MIKKHQLATLLIIFLGTLTSTEARLHPNPGEFGAEAEWVFFHPSIDNPFFALAGNFNKVFGSFSPTLTLESNDFDYNSGYRVGAAYRFCCLDLTARVRWTQQWNEISQDLNEPALIAPIGRLFFNVVTSSITNVKNSLDFYSLDVTFETQAYCNPCCFDLVLFGGVQYSAAEAKQHIDYQIPNGFGQSIQVLAHTDESTCFYGVGPEVGFDASYHLGCGFGITGNGRCGLLVSRMDADKETSSQLVQSQPPPIITTNKDSIERNWRFVPSFGLRFGVHYGCAFRCASFDLEAGYEALSLFRALPIVTSVVFDNYWNITGYSNVDFHGPYLNLAITF